MAEINIEPKKRSGWAWLIVVLILLVIGWLLYVYVFQAQNDTNDTTGTPMNMILSFTSALLPI